MFEYSITLWADSDKTTILTFSLILCKSKSTISKIKVGYIGTRTFALKDEFKIVFNLSKKENICVEYDSLIC